MKEIEVRSLGGKKNEKMFVGVANSYNRGRIL